MRRDAQSFEHRRITERLPLAFGLLVAAHMGWASAWSATQGFEVPLELYTDAHWPSGVLFGGGYGVSFLDFDRDGWADLYVHHNGTLWRNVEGRTWVLASDLDVYLPHTRQRYGAACADYDADGLPDIATEQYGDCFYLLKNLGAARFVEVASIPAIVIGQPCGMYSETACWADVDGDGDLDLFVPAYPDWVIAGGGGNRFWENLGRVGPRGSYQLRLSTPEAGLEIPAGYPRPEGAQFCDVDRDGDVDLFANHVLYQNLSRGPPRFATLRGASTGIAYPGDLGHLDEGAVFFDYDLDGDQDLAVLISGSTLRLWENRGDATFFAAEGERVQSPRSSPWTGLSAEDWDQDGDLDMVSARIFRRNTLVESGVPYLALATAGVPAWDRSVAWADWDHDGDPDCVFKDSHFDNFFYRNTSYDVATPAQLNRSIRVRAVRDSATVAGGLETEFGATVELRVRGDESGVVRRRFVASSHGYLQQNEYALTMALPSGPDPNAPARGVYFDLSLDFIGASSEGLLRIDPSVNAALGSIHLAKLRSREITVYRSGMVEMEGQKYAPHSTFTERLLTAGDGPPSITSDATLPVPTPAPSSDWFVGVEIATPGPGRVRVEELVLDGVLATPGSCDDAFNVALWDVTAPDAPRPIWRTSAPSQPRNRRQFLPAGFELDGHRIYRLVCRVTELRPAAWSQVPSEPLRVLGGISFRDLDPCKGTGVVAATVDPARTCLWLRFRAPKPTPELPRTAR